MTAEDTARSTTKGFILCLGLSRWRTGGLPLRKVGTFLQDQGSWRLRCRSQGLYSASASNQSHVGPQYLEAGWLPETRGLERKNCLHFANCLLNVIINSFVIVFSVIGLCAWKGRESTACRCAPPRTAGEAPTCPPHRHGGDPGRGEKGLLWCGGSCSATADTSPWGHIPCDLGIIFNNR